MLEFLLNLFIFLLFYYRFHLTSTVNQASQPMLVNEYFKVSTNIMNAFDACLENVGISIAVPNNLRNKGNILGEYGMLF